MEFRVESDSLGEGKVPREAYYGIQTQRAAENFPITGQRINLHFIHALAYVKKAAAITNERIDELTPEVGQAIIKACDEILAGKMIEDFITDPIQGGAGTSMNMNANEVIANRANEILGGEKGKYDLVHPNDHVNLGQSTNDVIPTAGKITMIQLMHHLEERLQRLIQALDEKGNEFNDVVKMGRTQMQDAVPIRLSQEFYAYRNAIRRDIIRLDKAIHSLARVNLGGTAVGTGINADADYIDQVVADLIALTGIDLRQANDLIDSTQNLDAFLEASSMIKVCAVNISKMSNDLRLMSSGPRTGFGEIILPSKQPGSSIMPGKVNPVIPEVMNQIAFNIIGNDFTITMAVEGGQLELNAFEPIIFYKLFESITTLTNGIDTFIDNCILGIQADRKRCRELVENSVSMATALCPLVGYTESANVAKLAMKSGRSVRDIAISQGILTESNADEMLDIFAMTEQPCDFNYSPEKIDKTKK